jgi:hypothetical protein
VSLDLGVIKSNHFATSALRRFKASHGFVDPASSSRKITLRVVKIRCGLIGTTSLRLFTAESQNNWACFTAPPDWKNVTGKAENMLGTSLLGGKPAYGINRWCLESSSRARGFAIAFSSCIIIACNQFV